MSLGTEISSTNNQERFHQLTRLYLARASVKHVLNLIESMVHHQNDISLAFQIKVLASTVHHGIALKFPASRSYQLIYLKKLINFFEEKGIEICDDLYQTYTSLLTGKEANGVNYTSYIIGEAITVEDYDNLVKEGTTGLHSWEAGKRFISFALANKKLFEGKKIFELGSGVGLTGIAICKLVQPSFYYFTDCDTKVISLIQRNTAINDCANYEIFSFYWESEESTTEAMLRRTQADLIIGTDLTYDPNLINPLMKVIRVAKKLEIEFLLLSTDRNTETPFMLEKQLIQACGIKWEKEIIHTEKDSFYYSASNPSFFLYKINIR